MRLSSLGGQTPSTPAAELARSDDPGPSPAVDGVARDASHGHDEGHFRPGCGPGRVTHQQARSSQGRSRNRRPDGGRSQSIGRSRSVGHRSRPRHGQSDRRAPPRTGNVRRSERPRCRSHDACGHGDRFERAGRARRRDLVGLGPSDGPGHPGALRTPRHPREQRRDPLPHAPRGHLRRGVAKDPRCEPHRGLLLHPGRDQFDDRTRGTGASSTWLLPPGKP